MSGQEKKEGKALTEKELYGLLLMEDEAFHDEGRDAYFNDVIEKVRKDIGTGKDRKT